MTKDLVEIGFFDSNVGVDLRRKIHMKEMLFGLLLCSAGGSAAEFPRFTVHKIDD